jgi:hypothetical protein
MRILWIWIQNTVSQNEKWYNLPVSDVDRVDRNRILEGEVEVVIISTRVALCVAEGVNVSIITVTMRKKKTYCKNPDFRSVPASSFLTRFGIHLL